MASYSGGGGGGPAGGDGSLNSLLAQLQRQQSQRSMGSNENLDQSTPVSAAAATAPVAQHQHQHQHSQYQQMADLRSHFNPYNSQASYYQQHQPADSPVPDDNATSAYLPAAPTPPAGPKFPPGMMARPEQRDATSLLDLLKLSSGQAGQQSSSQPTAPQSQQSDQLRRESLIRHASDQGASTIHAPAPSSADPTGLLAALMKGKFQEDVPKPAIQQQQAQPPQAPASNWNNAAPSDNTQQYLLNLLNRPKPSQNNAPAPVESASEATHSIELTPPSPSETNRHNDYTVLEQDTNEGPAVPTSSFDFAPKDSEVAQLKFEPSIAPDSSRDGTPSTKAAMFSYSNPFEELAAVSKSPQNRTAKNSDIRGVSMSPNNQAKTNAPIQILKKPGPGQAPVDHKRLSSTSSHLENREHIRRKMDSTPNSQDRQHPDPPYPVREVDTEATPKESVAEAVSEVAGKVNKEVQEALTRAEDEESQARITQDLRDLMAATNEKDFEAAAAIAASDIRHQLDKEENRDALESALRPEIAKAVRDIVEDAAQGPVADSWESAEAEDDIVVIEETTKPVTVFNFPMKPWISMSVLDAAMDSRPVFRDEAILDIARLKKEFDQIDRNLVASSENYLAYGMSKAGGLRVIRQDDGRDAKLFSDTKDRIFNVGISSISADENTSSKESIIGTGISGTVYWVQVKDGEKDHLEDAHLEQYGFALPPTASQEGDAPGGVLKTRARTPTSRPEYFAVGRGKSINIIFPAYVMQGHLFKPGHDRVVDTDRLNSECQLRINTGKAGKDFTFSQDDTVVVSLDKSGRVKFWDVRDLTASDENRMPTHKSFEVKDPLMTLTTTPEGEKAWPTSVLLLDKLRPYQKRTALRYLIVGMKQNHTLQLWDLALGKPVQEFNLPHSKESDAVCSVMYHPPSGIIVVGHPTRNSIYFLHLSAPKYALKNNPSQVEYIQRLAAQDTSIPTPDSTAVISGMREYSFANKGVLRSLYLLQQPASASEGDQATMFELYAMHSKGVACLSIKGADLGWDKENKVIDAVDAVSAGVVQINKLKQPPPPPQYQSPEESVSQQPQIRLAVRPKEAASEAAPEQTLSRKARDEASPHKQKETKEEEPAVPVVSEKSEKKQRKKKAAAAEKAAAAAAALAEREREASFANGNTPRVVTTTSHKPAEPSKSSPTFSEEVDTRIQAMEKRLSHSIIGSLQAELSGLRKKLDQDGQTRDSEFSQRQGQLLNIVSSVLNENCQEVLSTIIQDELESNVTPMIEEVLTKAVSTQLSGKVNNSITQSVQKEMLKTMPSAMDQALRKPELVKSIADKLVPTLANKIDEQLYSLLDDRIIPRFTKLATDAATSCGKEIMVNVNNQFSAMEQLRVKDMQKFEQLVALNTGMSETLNTMVSAQAQFHEEILRLQTQLAKQRQVSPPQTGVRQGRGNGAFHSPAHSQSQALQHMSASSTAHQQLFNSPQASVANQQFNNSSAAAMSPHQQQEWAGNSSTILSPAHSQYLGQSGALQAVNPNVLALQQSQQYGSPTSQSSASHISSQQQAAQQAQQLAREQLVFQPTTKDNRERLDMDELCQRVRTYMTAGNYDDAVMTWIQESKDEDAVFGQVLAQYDVSFIRSLNPLLLLTVAATVTSGLEKQPQLLQVKLSWTEMVLITFYEALPRIEGQVREITPKVMGLIKNRLEHVFMRLNTTAPNDPALRNISTMIHYTQKITDSMRLNVTGPSY